MGGAAQNRLGGLQPPEPPLDPPLFVLVSSRMSLPVIMSMILVFMAVFLMLAKHLTESIILFFLIGYFSVIYLLSSQELFSIGTLTRMSVYPGMVNFLTNSLFQMGCVRVEFFLLSCSLFILTIY